MTSGRKQDMPLVSFPSILFLSIQPTHNLREMSACRRHPFLEFSVKFPHVDNYGPFTVVLQIFGAIRIVTKVKNLNNTGIFCMVEY